MGPWKHFSKQITGVVGSYAIYLLNQGHCSQQLSDQLLRNANDQLKKKKVLCLKKKNWESGTKNDANLKNAKTMCKVCIPLKILLLVLLMSIT